MKQRRRYEAENPEVLEEKGRYTPPFIPYGKDAGVSINIPKKLIALAVVVIVLRLASEPTANASYFVLALWALGGRAQIVQALFLTWVLIMINPGLAPPASLEAVGRYAVFGAAALSALLRFGWENDYKISRPVLATLLIGVFFIIHSLLVSPIKDVSILKAVNFTMVFATLLSAWGGMNAKERVETEIFVFGGMILIVLASLPFIKSGVGYLRNGTGFQGILNHPNAFGVFIAMIGSWLAARFLSERKLPWWQIGLLTLIPLLAFASEARSALGALGLGMAVPMFFLLVFRPRRLRMMLPGMFTARFAFAIWVGMLGLLAYGTVVYAQLEHYITKSGRSKGEDLVSALEESRGGLVEIMLENIKEHPISGIGFGIASYPEEMLIKRDPVFDLPIGASIEKGVMPVALIEELGIPGGIIVFIWIFTLLRRAAWGGFTPLAVFATALFTNLGENTFFSVGGLGLLLMVLTTWSTTARKTINRGLK